MSLSKKIAPHVAAVHDLSGMGRCSLGVILPVLSAMGCWCSSLPTAYLSANTIFPPSDQFIFRDFTGEMAGSARHWAELDVRFDAIYSGFMGSEEQMDVVEDFIHTFRRENTLVLIDPVMGDWGKPYRTYTPAMCRRMCSLARLADVITPNLTEAAILLDERYEDVPQTPEGLGEWLRRLSLEGSRSVILTGITPEKGRVGAGCYDRATGEVSFSITQEAPAQFPGTGDLFAAVALGTLLQGRSLDAAAEKAVDFVAQCARFTLELGAPIEHGVQFESLLGRLTARGKER